MPKSELSSAELEVEYQGFLRWLAASPSPPPIQAPQSVWDAFDSDSNRSIAAYLERMQTRYPASIEETTIGGVRVRTIAPRTNLVARNERRILVNLHGGGFVAFRGLEMGTLESLALAVLGGFKIVTIDYKHTPYAQYPVATEEVVSVYSALLQHYEAASIGIFGTSAGAMLAGQVVAWLRASGQPRPGGVGMFWGSPSPFFIPSAMKRGDSMRDMPPPTINQTMDWYMASASATDPKAFPDSSDANLADFPPALFVTGTRAFDMSAVITANARFLKLGVDSSLYVVEAGWHGMELFAIGTPEQRDLDSYKARWFDRHLAV